MAKILSTNRLLMDYKFFDVDSKISKIIRKINPKFRELADSLLFSTKIDVDKKLFISLYNEQIKINHKYILDRYIRASFMFIDNGSALWNYRLSLLLSLGDARLNSVIESNIVGNTLYLFKTKMHVHPSYDPIYTQFIELCKIKASKKETIVDIRNAVVKLILYIKPFKLLNIVKSLIPAAFKDINDFIKILFNDFASVPETIKFITELDKSSTPYDKGFIKTTFLSIMNSRSIKHEDCQTLFNLFSKPDFFDLIKENYDKSCAQHLKSIVLIASSYDMESNNFFYLKKLVDLDPSMADEIVQEYIQCLYLRYFSHENAKVDKVVGIINNIPEVNPKKIIIYLNSISAYDDIVKITKHFPDLKKLLPFI